MTARLLAPLVAAALSASPASAIAATEDLADPATFHARVLADYGFERKDLKDLEEIKAQSARLDGFWQAVAADRERLLPLLRAELARNDAPWFFRFDGAELLTTLSSSDEDWALALGSVRQVRPENVDGGGYLIALNRYSARGMDTRPMAWRWLEWKAPEVMVDRGLHVFWPSTLEALVWSLYGIDEHLVAADLIGRLEAAKSDTEIALLIQALWTTATPEGHAALESYAADKRHRKKARKFAADMLRHGPDTPPSATRSEAELRAARLEILRDPWRHGAFAAYHRLTDELVVAAGLKRP